MRWISVLGVVGFLGGVALGQAPCGVDEVRPLDPLAEKGFGNAVELLGDLAVVAASGDDELGPNAGAVYVFRLTDGLWAQSDKLLPTVDTGSRFFGSSIDFDGETLVVTSIELDEVGALVASLYFYEENEGALTLSQKHVFSDPEVRLSSVSVLGDVLIAGSSTEQTGSGAVYVFDRHETGWSQSVRLVASDGGMNDGFGGRVSLGEDLFVVGASGWDMGATADNTGQAYVFEFVDGQWQETARLTSAMSQVGSTFGAAVKTSSGAVFVSGPRHGFSQAVSRVSVFRRDGEGWSEDQILDEPYPDSLIVYGSSLDVDGDVMVVSAPVNIALPSTESAVGARIGSTHVYRFQGSEWVLARTIRDEAFPDNGTSERQAVAVSGERVMIGRERASTNGIRAGDVLTTSTPFETGCCRGDCDSSGVVDFGDLVSMLFAFGDTTQACDADMSGAVDFNDLVAALFLFGACP